MAVRPKLEERRKKVEALIKTISWKDFVFLSSDGGGSGNDGLRLRHRRRPKPWILVPNGSILGYFDWVPEYLRVGPWSIVTVPYILLQLTLMVVATVYMIQLGNKNSAAANANSNSNTSSTTESWPYLQEEYQAFTLAWYYNVIGFFWMSFVTYQVYLKAGLYPMVTYTMQSWIFLHLRHGLAALVPLVSNNNTLLYSYVLFWAESLRFLALSTALITFIFWNGFVGPTIYFFMKDEFQKAGFLQYFSSFRLTQLHVFNMVYAIINGLYASPRRRLAEWDLYVAAVYATLYLLFYMLVLDRLGVHLYPIYSPRTPWIVFTLTLNIVCYISSFWVWQYFLSQPKQ